MKKLQLYILLAILADYNNDPISFQIFLYLSKGIQDSFPWPKVSTALQVHIGHFRLQEGLSSKSKLSLASFNLANAKANQEDIKIKYESQLSNIESQIASVKSRLKNIELDIGNTFISAPFDGIISDKMIEVSEFITPGNILFTIIDLNPIKVQGYLSEFDVNKVQVGTKAIIENSNGIEKTGKISFISPSAETSTRTFEITIEATNSAPMTFSKVAILAPFFSYSESE